MMIRRTQSLCPVCLRRIEAAYETRPEEPRGVVLSKVCPEHGPFSVPAWTMPAARTPAPPAFGEWRRDKCPSYPAAPRMTAERGCPFDCGLCPAHAQHTCTGLVEVTRRCNLACPVCYAGAGGPEPGADPSLADIAAMLDCLISAAGACNVQISGGEPTMREDLPAIAALARERGFALVQINTNGLRLGREAGYAERLRAAGADSVYLQYDGLSASVFDALRGRHDIAEEKHEAIRACAAAGLGIVLVATLARGVNDGELGNLLRFALAQGPNVRGVHLQPAASFGRFPWSPESAPRLTLPELMAKLEEQAPELVRTEHFHPPGCEHALCSFSASYARIHDAESGRACLAPLHGAERDEACRCPPPAAEGAQKARRFVSRHWRGVMPDIPPPRDDFAAFIARAGLDRRFTISAMAFQDALSLDLERVRGCCIHVARPDGRLIPFCLHNLTSHGGARLYA
ncbi:MAG: radical SAM protein [Desulfovibrio sp.]|nr:radical SAM protein [Desulfovibrio sp.]